MTDEIFARDDAADARAFYLQRTFRSLLAGEKTQVETKDVNMDEFVEILKQDGSKKA